MDESKTVTIPRFLYESLISNDELIRYLTFHRGRGWVEAVRKEMESDKKYGIGMFGEKGKFNGKHL